MQSLYYYTGSISASGSNLIFVPNNDRSDEYLEYAIDNLIVCSSLQQVLLYSGSDIIISVPVENTNIYYLSSSEYPARPVFPAPLPFIIQPYLSSSINWSFTTSENIIPNDSKLIITGSNLNITQSQYSNSNTFQHQQNDQITVVVSGSGVFYSSSILIYDDLGLVSSSYTSSSPLSLSFIIPSASNIIYNIVSETSTIPYIKLTYDNEINIPIYPTNSLDDWNALLSITASSIFNTGSTIYLIDGNIPNLNSLTLSDSASANLANMVLVGLSNMSLLSVTTGSLYEFPTIQGSINLYSIIINNTNITSSNLQTYSPYFQFSNLCNNKISGSILDIVQNASESIQLLSCSFNNLTGSVPDLSTIPALGYLDCSNNQLSGSIISFSSSYGLYHFDCSDNALTGSIPSVNDLISLNYFDVSNNKLFGNIPTFSSSSILQYLDLSNNQFSGSIPTLSSNISLQRLDVSFNNCSGDIPSLSNNTQLTYVDLYQNQLSGSIPDLSNLTLLEFFDCGRNNLTGSIPNLDNNVLLQQFSCQDNDLSGSIPSLTNNTALFAFDASDNYITGSIPYLGNTSLQVISVANNQLTGYVSGSVPSSLTVFLAQINQLSQPAVDGILEDLDNAGATGPSAFALLNGGTNSTPSATGLTYKANLQAKGWTVLTN